MAAMRRAPSVAPAAPRVRPGEDDREPPADEEDDGPARRRRRRRRRVQARIAGIVGSLMTMLLLPEEQAPDGEQAGQLSVMYDMSDYLFYAGRAYEYGFAGYGDTTICLPRAQDGNPPAELVINNTKRIVGRAQSTGIPLFQFYAGKTSVHASDPFDPAQWYTESLVRFRQHRAAAAGWKITFLAATYTNECDALETERRLVVELGGATGLVCANRLPYKQGKLSHGNADGYAVYVQAR